MNISSKLDSNELFWDVELVGELDINTANKLKIHLTNLVDEQLLDMKINAQNLQYIDSTGLGVLIGILKKLKECNKEIYILKPRKNVEKIFNITGLEKIFKLEG